MANNIHWENIKNPPRKKYWLTVSMTKKLPVSCYSARRKSRACAQKYWLTTFTEKISSCVRRKSRSGVQTYLTVVTNKISRNWTMCCHTESFFLKQDSRAWHTKLGNNFCIYADQNYTLTFTDNNTIYGMMPISSIAYPFIISFQAFLGYWFCIGKNMRQCKCADDVSVNALVVSVHLRSFPRLYFRRLLIPSIPMNCIFQISFVCSIHHQ